MSSRPFPFLTKRRFSSPFCLYSHVTTTLTASLFLLTCTFIYIYISLLPFYSHPPLKPIKKFKDGLFKENPTSSSSFQPFNVSQKLGSCDFFRGHWIEDHKKKPFYGENCPFHRNAWNCLGNKRENMEKINSWRWVPEECHLPVIDPVGFLDFMRNKKIGFVGDSLNENFLASFLCILRVADDGARKWKRKGAWRGGYFPKFNVTVGYHRAVLLAKYEWQPMKNSNVSDPNGLNGTYRVDVQIPADDWVNITKFYDVLVFNTGHWWGFDKFPKERPLVFYRKGEPISPPLEILDGLRVVLESIVSYIEREVSTETLKFWHTQSPRHFYGGEWNKNGSCMFDEPLEEAQLDIWFDPNRRGVNKEARLVNSMIKQAIHGTSIKLLDLTHLSEFRADAHPAVWLGKSNAVSIWGQDCMHWCLPGLPDTWVDILSALIRYYLEIR